MKNEITRRDFIKKGSSAAFTLGMTLKSGSKLISEPAKKARVVEVTHADAVSAGRKVNVSIVRKMLKESLRKLTGTDNPWSKFVGPSDKIGLKINTLGRPVLFTHHELIQAVADDLVDYGVKKNNVIVWDRHERHMKDAGFTFNTTDEGVRCYGTEVLDEGQDRFDQDTIYESDQDDPEKRDNGSKISRISRIFTQDCDKIINLAILKDHGYCGLTLCLKNLAYGLSGNNGRFHGPEHIGPFIADFCSLPLVREKVVLHIIDGLEGCFDQGPVPRSLKTLFTPNTLWMGLDPVALDAVGLQVIEAERRKKGLPSLKEAGRPVDQIELAVKKDIGVGNLAAIKIEKIQL